MKPAIPARVTYPVACSGVVDFAGSPGIGLQNAHYVRQELRLPVFAVKRTGLDDAALQKTKTRKRIEKRIEKVQLTLKTLLLTSNGTFSFYICYFTL